MLFRSKQQRFLLKAVENLNLPLALFAGKIGVHKRTLNDWKREEYSMPFNVLEEICAVTKLKIPKNIKIRGPFWYVNKGAKVGGLAVYKKYGRIGGDPEYRKKKWYEWWERDGKYKSNIIGVIKPVKKPDFSEKLAEFVGLMIGDGGITKTQVTVSLNCKTDKSYSIFVANLIKKLFKVKPSFYFGKNALVVNIVVSRTHLVKFCKSIGLKVGNKLKQGLDIPNWVKRNKQYRIACLRGLVDTDGCVFTHSYRVNGNLYKYKKLVFTSYSKPLRYSVFKIMKDNGLNPRLAQGRDVRLDRVKDMKRYFRLVGSHNPKHLNKYYKSVIIK